MEGVHGGGCSGDPRVPAGRGPNSVGLESVRGKYRIFKTLPSNSLFFLSWEWRDSSRGVQNRSGSIVAPIWGLYVAFVGPFCEIFARYWVILGVGTVFLLSFGVVLGCSMGKNDAAR